MRLSALRFPVLKRRIFVASSSAILGREKTRRENALYFVIAEHSPSKTGVNAL
jgi:hypothetical protein